MNGEYISVQDQVNQVYGTILEVESIIIEECKEFTIEDWEKVKKNVPN